MQRPEDSEATRRLPEGHAESRRIGAYVLREKIGEGGMGEVWLAEQQEPIQRQVALKLIKPGMDTAQVVARFEAERQALAMMDHPAIAKIYDAAATPEGRPYFVMEYVRGVPITEHCDRHMLSSHQRLLLFTQVCEGVQHAHQKAVIHRDLKPSNVLVTIQDNEPHPKIIDFGVAKATGQRLTDRTMHTQLGTMIGTPAYMSPEQAEMTGQDVDTRTDVYSLGVLLYELLVGTTPFDRHDLVKLGYEAMVRKLREEEPLKPSTRLSTLNDESKQMARKRQTEPGALKRELAGDLDWITMKALEKDRTRRYGSPAELADDIRRHLNDQPVEAGSPGTVYRARKFVRRHRAAVAAVALLGFALVVGIAGLAIGLQRAIAAEKRALAAETNARQEAETSQRIATFLTEMFQFSNPSDAESRDVTARELLDAGADRIREDLTDTPLVRASLMGTIGEVYTNLGEYDAAESLLRDALSVREEELGPEAVEVADSVNKVAVFLAQTGRLADAKPLFARALEIREEQLGPNDLNVAQSLNNLAIAVRRLGDHDAAIPLTERALAIRERVQPESALVADSSTNLGNIYFEVGRSEDARRMYERALAIQEAVNGPRHADVGSALVNLGNVETWVGEHANARASYERALDVWSETLDPDHPLVGYGLTNLAELLAEMGEWEAARGKYTEALSFRERTLGPDHLDLTYPLNGLAHVLLRLDEPERSLELFDRAKTLRQEALGKDHPEMLVILDEYADALSELGHDATAKNIRAQADELRGINEPAENR